MSLFPPTVYRKVGDRFVVLERMPGPKLRTGRPSKQVSMARTIAKGMRVGMDLDAIPDYNRLEPAWKEKQNDGWLFVHFKDDSMLGIYHESFGGKEVVVGFGFIQHSWTNVMTIDERIERLKANARAAESERIGYVNVNGMFYDHPTMRESVERLIPGWQVARNRGSGGYKRIFFEDFLDLILDQERKGLPISSEQSSRFSRWMIEKEDLSLMIEWVDVEKKRNTNFRNFLALRIPEVFEK